MNIVFITDAWQPLTGGGQKLYWEVLSRLAKKNWQITVVTRALRYQGKLYDKNESYFKNRLQIIRLGPVVSFFNPIARLWFIFQSWWYCVKLDPDRYMATTWLPALTLQLIKVFKKTPLVLLAIGFGSRYKWIEDLLTRGFKYDLVITDDWTFKEGKFIPNGVNLSRAQSRDKWRNFTFLFIGRNEPRKGAELLKQAFLQVQRHYPNVRLRLIGPGFKLVSQDQLDGELFKAHCLVLPSLREGHPLILFEAWAHRLPVIATNVGSVSQFVNAKNGYLILPGDADALTQALIKAINNKNLSGMGEAGYDLVKNYTWDKTVTAYANILKCL